MEGRKRKGKERKKPKPTNLMLLCLPTGLKSAQRVAVVMTQVIILLMAAKTESEAEQLKGTLLSLSRNHKSSKAPDFGTDSWQSLWELGR